MHCDGIRSQQPRQRATEKRTDASAPGYRHSITDL